MIEGIEDVYDAVGRWFFGLDDTDDLAELLEYEDTDSRAAHMSNAESNNCRTVAHTGQK